MNKLFWTALFLISLNSITVAHTEQPKESRLPPVPWEVMGASDDSLYLTRIERLQTPEGWIVKIMTMNSSRKQEQTVNYMYIRDVKHVWPSFSEQEQKIRDQYQAMVDSAQKSGLWHIAK